MQHKNQTCAKRLAPATATAALAHAPPLLLDWALPMSAGAYLNSVAFSPILSQLYIRKTGSIIQVRSRIGSLYPGAVGQTVPNLPALNIFKNPISPPIPISHTAHRWGNNETDWGFVKGKASSASTRFGMVFLGDYGRGRVVAICCCGENLRFMVWCYFS